MPSNIVAYEWPLNGTAHIAYETDDNHIHEMAIGQKGTWRDNDITRAAGSPELENAILAGFSWSDGHTQQIAYTSLMDANGHIYELVMYQDHPWSVEDIMRQARDAAPADGFTLVGYAWKAAGTKHLVYSGRDGHLHELSAGIRGLWKYSDLTQVTGAPLAENSLLAAFAWETGKQRQVIYVSGDGHIHELMSGMDGVWKHTDLTTVAGAPLAGDSALAASAWETGRAKYVAYVGSNNHIYELQMPLQGAWEHIDLTQLLGAPEASEDDVAAHEWTPEFAKHIVYLDTAENPHIHSLMLKHGRQWQHTDVTGLTGSQSIV
jgi:hypothetical protein